MRRSWIVEVFFACALGVAIHKHDTIAQMIFFTCSLGVAIHTYDTIAQMLFFLGRPVRRRVCQREISGSKQDSNDHLSCPLSPLLFCHCSMWLNPVTLL